MKKTIMKFDSDSNKLEIVSQGGKCRPHNFYNFNFVTDQNQSKVYFVKLIMKFS